MNGINLSGLIILGFALLTACKKDSKITTETAPETVQPPSWENYSGLKPGNYWIYKDYYISMDTESETSIVDSTYIVKDSLIRGKVYYQLFSALHQSSRFLRDSLHYIVDHNGAILFSSEKFNQLLNTSYYLFTSDTLNKNDTLFKLELSMSDKDRVTTVPAGTFNTLDAITKINNVNFAPPTSTIYPMYAHSKYAAGIGLVYSSMPYSSGHSTLVKKLLRYHVKK